MLLMRDFVPSSQKLHNCELFCVTSSAVHVARLLDCQCMKNGRDLISTVKYYRISCVELGVEGGRSNDCSSVEIVVWLFGASRTNQTVVWLIDAARRKW